MIKEQIMNNASLADMETFARTIWGEARGESEEGQAAVAWVMRNRVMLPRLLFPER